MHAAISSRFSISSKVHGERGWLTSDAPKPEPDRCVGSLSHLPHRRTSHTGQYDMLCRDCISVGYLQSRQVKCRSSTLRRSFAGRTRRLRGVIATTLHRLFPGCGEVWRRICLLWRDLIRRRATRIPSLNLRGCAWQKQRKIDITCFLSPMEHGIDQTLYMMVSASPTFDLEQAARGTAVSPR